MLQFLQAADAVAWGTGARHAAQGGGVRGRQGGAAPRGAAGALLLALTRAVESATKRNTLPAMPALAEYTNGQMPRCCIITLAPPSSIL